MYTSYSIEGVAQDRITKSSIAPPVIQYVPKVKAQHTTAMKQQHVGSTGRRTCMLWGIHSICKGLHKGIHNMLAVKHSREPPEHLQIVRGTLQNSSSREKAAAVENPPSRQKKEASSLPPEGDLHQEALVRHRRRRSRKAGYGTSPEG